MTAEELYALLGKTQEPLGYYFNNDRALVLDVLNGLLENKGRYGYMSCPCRLASGKREEDSDIICPCRYRAKDVEEFGSCYCGLYVSKPWNDNLVPRRFVPERRRMV